MVCMSAPTATPLTRRDLQHYLEQHAIPARLIAEIGHTPTVPAAAQALGVAADQIIKTLLFVLDGAGRAESTPPAVVVISNGEHRINKKSLGHHFGLNPKRVKLAPAETVIELLGYPAGGVPPFGHRTPLPVLLDRRVVETGAIYGGQLFGGGGDDVSMLELHLDDLLRVHQPLVLPLSEQAA
jgi:prolyl-tRNA editing enzyme YbaK/EbsC (Cys-tRNA(Pro) deacylase)